MSASVLERPTATIAAPEVLAPEIELANPHIRTKWDKQREETGEGLEVVRDGARLVQVHDTTNLLLRFKYSEMLRGLAPDDRSRPAYEMYAKVGHLEELNKLLKSHNPILYAQLLHYTKLSLTRPNDLKAQLRAERREIPKQKIVFSKAVEEYAVLAVGLGRKYGEDPQEILDDIV